MTKKIRVVSEKVGEPPGETWSNCLVVGNQVFIAGMTARGAEFDIVSGAGEYQQAHAIFTKIQHLITTAGGSMADIVKVNIFVTDITKRQEVWRARREFFPVIFPSPLWSRSAPSRCRKWSSRSKRSVSSAPEINRPAAY